MRNLLHILTIKPAMKFDWGPTLFRQLSGVFCIYKPSGPPMFKVMAALEGRLAEECNALPCFRHERKIPKADKIQANFDIKLPVTANLPMPTDDLSQHKLALGPRYIPEDFRMATIHELGPHDAGVVVLGLGLGRKFIHHIENARFLRVYHVQGRLGYATHNFTPKGRPIERTSFHHVTKHMMDKVCAQYQANHTRHMFEYAGVQADSQEAYELAASGLIRPESGRTPPILYGIKCIKFNLPDFTLEIHSINEKSQYLKTVIHNMGLQLKTTAVCAHIRRIRYGHFQLEHALLRKHWTAENILKNIQLCHKYLSPEKLLTDESVKQVEDGESSYPRLESGLGTRALSGGSESESRGLHGDIKEQSDKIWLPR